MNQNGIQQYISISQNGECQILKGIQNLPSGICANNLNIKRVTISGGCDYLGNDTFNGCSNLETLIFEDNANPRFVGGSRVFKNCPKLKKVYFANWETFWNYMYDNDGGPLSNGADLYVKGKYYDIVEIPASIPKHGIITLKGAHIKDLKFPDDIPVGVNDFVSKKSLIENILNDYPCAKSMFTITWNIKDILSNADKYRWIRINQHEIEQIILHELYPNLSSIVQRIANEINNMRRSKNMDRVKYKNYKEIMRILEEWTELFKRCSTANEDEELLCTQISEIAEIEFDIGQLHKLAINYAADFQNGLIVQEQEKIGRREKVEAWWRELNDMYPDDEIPFTPQMIHTGTFDRLCFDHNISPSKASKILWGADYRNYTREELELIAKEDAR